MTQFLPGSIACRARALIRRNTTDHAKPVARFQRGKVPLFLISLKAVDIERLFEPLG